jgi:xanthine dehydrogenase YagR molybdenum-binding subunit
MTDEHIYIGKPLSRYDGVEKVTGRARYAADFQAEGMVHAVVVSSAIAVGRILELNCDQALAVPGVLAVFSHKNCPPVARRDKAYQDQVSPPGSPFRPFRDNTVHFSGQPIALVVAQTFEAARHAAALVRPFYDVEPCSTDLDAVRADSYEPPKKRSGMNGVPDERGDAEAALSNAAHLVRSEFHTPPAHHNPMEMHATTVIWKSDTELLVHDKSQGAQNSHAYICSVFGYSKDDVVVDTPFVGGGFGSGLRPQYQLFLAVLAARALQRSVQLMLTRQQMFSFSHRPETMQEVALAADADGALQAVSHEATGATSTFEDYQEDVVYWAELLYRTQNATYGYELAKLDISTPSDMRAPGGGLGMFALESAVDELAASLRCDPLELRLRNYAEKDQFEDRPFSTKELRACFAQGAERFGWSRRRDEPRMTRESRQLIGLGMAAGIWEANVMPTKARARLMDDGRYEIATAMADIGTGTYTIVRQVAAEILAAPIEQVTVRLGDSRLPTAPVEGGSFGAASATSAVQAACLALREAMDKRAAEGGSGANDHAPLEAEGSSDPYYFNTAKSMLGLKSYSSYSHSAVFAEVAVDADLAVIRVRRIVAAVDAGRILNPKTARSQIIGGVTWGMSMALHEESLMDHAHGRFMNHSFSEYHVPVCADIPEIDVIFVETPDTKLNPLGVKGLGEIGLVGTAAAIANAVHNATGARMRALPITIDRLLPAMAAAA